MVSGEWVQGAATACQREKRQKGQGRRAVELVLEAGTSKFRKRDKYRQTTINLSACIVLFQTMSEQNEIKQRVIGQMHARSDALVRKDVPALARLLADEFVYINAG